MTCRWYSDCYVVSEKKSTTVVPQGQCRSTRQLRAAFDWVEKLSTVSVVACTAWVTAHVKLVVSSLALVGYGCCFFNSNKTKHIVVVEIAKFTKKMMENTFNNIQQLSKTLKLQGISLCREFAPLLWPLSPRDGLGLLLRWFGQWGSHQRPPGLHDFMRLLEFLTSSGICRSLQCYTCYTVLVFQKIRDKRPKPSLGRYQVRQVLLAPIHHDIIELDFPKSLHWIPLISQ